MSNPSTLAHRLIGAVLVFAFMASSILTQLHGHGQFVDEPHEHRCAVHHGQDHSIKAYSGLPKLKQTTSSSLDLSTSTSLNHCDLCALFLLEQPQKPNHSKSFLVELETFDPLEFRWKNNKVVPSRATSTYQARAGPVNV
jgi:hypothetical protein